MSQPLHVAILRICHRGAKRRLWLAGRRLAECGFEPGVDYAIARRGDALEITLTQGLGRKVHRKFVSKRSTPVIDIANAEIETFSKGRDVRIRARFFPGRIVVTLHPDDESAGRREAGTAERVRTGRPMRMGSLAHGIGVLDHALHEGLSSGGVAAATSFSVEMDERYLEASIGNNPVWRDGGTSIHSRIQDVALDDIPEIDVLAAGLPCTAASLAGRAATRREPERHPDVGLLFMHFLRIVEKANPTIVLLENVPAYARTLSFHAIRETLLLRGYAVNDAIIDGASHGSLEARKRLVMIARPPAMPDPLALIEETPSSGTIADILDAEVDPDAWFSDAYVRGAAERHAAKGNNFKARLLEGNEARVPVLTHGYATTRATNPYLKHESEEGLIRRFTPTEHARIKTVPARLADGLPPSTAHEALGQGVIHRAFVHLGEAIARSLRAWALNPA